MKNIYIRIVLLVCLVLLTPSFAYAVEPTATPTAVPTPPPAQLGIVAFCPATAHCATDASCSQTDNPVMKVHRLKFTSSNISSVANSNLFFEECITDNTSKKFCVPLPLETSDNVTYSIKAGTASWASDKALFMNAIKQRCKAGYTSSQDAAEACKDTTIEGNQGYIDLNNKLISINYEFNGLLVANATGGLDYVTSPQPKSIPDSGYEWGSASTTEVSRYIQVIKFVGFGGATNQGGGNTPHVSQLGMPNPQATCQSASYDPYGKVFDSSTLRPVSGVNVWIFEKQADSTYTKYISSDVVFTNPFKSTTFGKFTFRLPEGTYKILAENNGAITNATVITPTTDLSGLTVLTDGFGSDDVTISSSGQNIKLYSNVYNSRARSPDIVQGTEPIHTNLAVSGISPNDTEVFAYEKNVTGAGFIVLVGQATAPYGKIEAVSKSNRVVKTTYSNFDGRFNLTIDPSVDLEPGEEFDHLVAHNPEYVRVIASLKEAIERLSQRFQLAIFDKVIKPVFAQVATPSVPSRLAYVEGSAYDTSGNTLPYTEIMIMDNTNFIVTFRTIADANGYFVIPPNRLPSGNYQILYKPQNSEKIIQVKTSEFVRQNSVYLTSQSVDLNKPVMSAQAESYVASKPELYPEIVTVVPVEIEPTASAIPNIEVTTDPSQQAGGSQGTISTALITYIVILLILIVGVTILVVYYLKRRQEPHLYENQF